MEFLDLKKTSLISRIDSLSMFSKQLKNYQNEQGVNKDRYQLIPRCLIFIKQNDCFLLLKGSPQKKIWANKYNGVGGHIEHDEDIKSAAQRELFEETGLTSNLDLRGIITVDPGGDVGVCIFVFTGDSYFGDLIPSKEGELHWVKQNELQNLPLVEDVQVILDQIEKMQKNSPPFIAHSSYNADGILTVNFRD